MLVSSTPPKELSKYESIAGWTVEMVDKEDETEKRKFEWIASITSRCEILVARKYREGGEYVVDVYLEIKGEGKMGFAYTPYQGQITVENVLRGIVSECTTFLTSMAVQQLEQLRESGRQVS